MQKARDVVAVLVDGTASRTEFDNTESKRVDADQCAGEGKMAAGVIELCTSLRWVCTQHVQ